MKVDKTETIFTEEDLTKALINGYRLVFFDEPTPNVIINAWSHCALECGRDGKGNIAKCRNFNLGNITVSQAQVDAGRDWWPLRCQEQLRDKDGKLTGEWKWFDMRFAANPSLLDGAIHYWTFFNTPNRKVALDAMHKGGSKEFTDALSAIRYMTANPEPYRKGLEGLSKRATDLVVRVFSEMDTLPPKSDPETSLEEQDEPTPVEVPNIVSIPLLVPERELVMRGSDPELVITWWTRFLIWLLGLFAPRKNPK